MEDPLRTAEAGGDLWADRSFLQDVQYKTDVIVLKVTTHSGCLVCT